jgi:hypothetical protein
MPDGSLPGRQQANRPKAVAIAYKLLTHTQVFTIQMLPIITASLHRAIQLQAVTISRNFTFESIITKISEKEMTRRQ